MAYGDSLGVTLPAVGDTSVNGLTVAAMINAAIQACVDRLEQQVTVAGLDINADLSLQSGGTQYGLTDVHRVSFFDQASALNAVTYPQALYAVGSDLYFNDDAGNQVRIVTGGGLDTSVVGGITGAGYGVSGIEVNWDGTGYLFKSGAGADAYTTVTVDDVLLRDGSGNAIRLAAPASMGADYTATLPGAVPGADAVLVMTTAGVISHSTNPAALTLAANGSVTVSGTGLFKHGTLTRRYHASAFQFTALDASMWTLHGDGYLTPLLGTEPARLSLTFEEGERILSVTVHIQADNVNTLTAKLYYNSTTVGRTQIGDAGGDVSVTGLGTVTDSLTPPGMGSGYTVVSGQFPFLEVTPSAADADLLIIGVTVTYDRP